MATYAAFKHVELYNVGSGKRRVLKPPGGGSSDIFAGSVDSASTPRSIKNHMKSNIFAAPSPIRGSTGDARRPQFDSHNRLFGESDRPYTPAKSRSKSNIPIGGDEADSSLKHSNGNGHTNSSREHINGSENGKSCDSNANYSHSTDNLDSSKYYGIDVNSSCKPTNYLNPTYNSKINLCINDDYISIVNNTKNNNNNHHHHENNNSNNRNPSGFRHKRESKFFDENMNYAATPLINNAHETKIFRKTLNSSFPTDGNSLNGETFKPSGENLAPSNHVVNKNRIPPGGFSSGLW